MAHLRVPTRLPNHLTSRRGGWISLVIVLVVFVALFGVFGQSAAPSGNDAAPPNSESARASALLAEFPDADEQSVLIVGSRTDGAVLTTEDLASLDALKPALDAQTGLEASGAMASEDGLAAVMITPITVGSDNAETARIVKDLRTSIADQPMDTLELQVTGGPAFGGRRHLIIRRRQLHPVVGDDPDRGGPAHCHLPLPHPLAPAVAGGRFR